MSGLNPPGPLAYAGQVAVPSIQRNFAPTTSDNKFGVPTIWSFPSAKKAYILVNKELGIADWLLFATSAGPIDTFITDDGHNVIPNSMGQVNLAGGNNISTSSVDLSDTATISVSGTTEYAVQVGSAAGALTSIPLGISGQILTSNGAGFNPSFQSFSGSGIITIDGDSGSMTGTTVTISGGTTGFTTIASGATMDLTGTLNVANGGTGATTLTGVLTGHGTGSVTGNVITQHDVLVGGASNAITSVSPSTANFVLTSNGIGSDPSFKAVSASGAIITVKADDATTASPAAGVLTLSGGSTGLTTTASGSTVDLKGILALASGGTNANLTASNGGIFYSNSTSGAILAGTATANQLLLSGASTTPLWSTSTYPTTNAVNTLLYASSANVMSALATADNGVLITSNSGVPSWLANGTAGQVLTANSGAPPSWQSSVTGVSSVTGTLPIVASPTTGAVVVSINAATTTTLGAASFNGTEFTVTAGAVSSNAITLTAGSGITLSTTSLNLGGALTISATGTGGTVTGLTVDTSTGPGTNPVLPSSGNIKVTGGTPISAGTNAFAIQTQSTAANTMELALQLAQGNATSQTNGFGIAQFNSNEFGVTGGFVTSNNFTINTGAGLSGGGSITLGGSLTLTASGLTFSWTDQSTSFSAAANNGYFCTATLTATLPTTPAQGSECLFAVDSASGKLTIQAPAGASIRLGNVVSATGGTAVSTKDGDSISLVYRVADLTWIAISSTGSWNVT